MDGKRHAGSDGGIDQREKMLERAVHASVGEQTHEMQRSAACACTCSMAARTVCVFAELTRCDRCVDDDHALRNDAPAAEIHVSDFAVAHDAFGQARPLRPTPASVVHG